MPTHRAVTASAVLDPRNLPEDVEFEGMMDLSPTNVDIKTSRHNEAAEVSIDALVGMRPDEATDIIDAARTPVLQVSVNDTVVGTGIVNRASVSEGEINEIEDAAGRDLAKLSITAYDAVRRLNQSTHSGTYDVDLADGILEDALASAGIPDSQYEFEFREIDDQFDEFSPEEEALIESPPPILMTKEFTDTPCVGVLDTVTQYADWIWWVDQFNIVRISNATHAPFQAHELSQVLDSSAGKQTAPWSSVVVTGGHDIGGETGTGADTHKLTGDPVRARAGEGEPIFHHQDASIHTTDEAQAVADATLKELYKQQAGGFVKIVGWEALRPQDGIQMPDSLGGEEYAIASISHSITSRDGFTTRIGCGGIIGDGGILPSEVEDEDEGETEEGGS